MQIKQLICLIGETEMHNDRKKRLVLIVISTQPLTCLTSWNHEVADTRIIVFIQIGYPRTVDTADALPLAAIPNLPSGMLLQQVKT